MAKVWYVRDGDHPTSRDPARDDLSLEQCIEHLGLTKNLPRTELNRPPRFGAKTDLPRERRHVVCEVDEAEALAHGWVPGFYRLVISPSEVAKRLGAPSVAP